MKLVLQRTSATAGWISVILAYKHPRQCLASSHFPTLVPSTYVHVP
jgi:hypothetical protein